MKIIALSIFKALISNLEAIIASITFIVSAVVFIKKYKIIKKSEYKALLKIKESSLDAEKLKYGLEYNHQFGIYKDEKTGETFCPTCLTNNKVRTHLIEESTDFGETYKCPVCNQTYRDKRYWQRVNQANEKNNNMYNYFQ
jgi:uncharacterized protein with PIN domain